MANIEVNLTEIPEGIGKSSNILIIDEISIVNPETAQTLHNLQKIKLEEQIEAAKVMEKLGKLDDSPYIGMGATISYDSDCYPYTVVAVSKSGKEIQIRKCDYKRIDKNGLSENQEYEYFEMPDASIRIVKFRKTKRYPNGVWKTQGGNIVKLGYRRAYQDPHF